MRVLMLAPWPIGRFLHGGQLRASAIARAYTARGHAVLCAGVYDAASATATEVEPHDYPTPAEIAQYVTAADRNSELGFWRALSRMPHSIAAYTGLIEEMRPDLLQFEEPYLWPLVRALRERGVLRGIPIVHSSYNYETDAKREIRASGMAVTDLTLADIDALEREIAAGVDAVIAVSEADAAAFRAIGAARVEVAPNGARLPSDCADHGEALEAYLQGEPFALFVSSAHPPNAQGLIDTVEASPTLLRQGSLLVCGGVGSLLRAMPGFAENQHIFRRTRLLGIVSPGLLGAMYQRARVVIQPKTRGGGSNLKTAEALISGRPLVATSRAFEGFERYASLPGVHVEDDPIRFWRRVADMLARPEIPQPELRSLETMGDLLWESCLSPMINRAEALVAAFGRRDPPRDR